MHLIVLLPSRMVQFMDISTVLGISHRKPQGDQLDQANPVRNDETGLWQCPFCLKNDFPELSEVCLILDLPLYL
jgi:hypothetical protein